MTEKYYTSLFLSIFICSCSENSEVISNTAKNTFTESYNSFYNSYYLNNNIESVTATNNISETIYYYNHNGNLHKIDSYSFDENGTKFLNEINSKSYELSYENGIMSKITYNGSGLLTHSTIEYSDNLLVKKSDFRDDELFYFTDYEYDDNTISYSKNTRLNSIGVRNGTSTVTFEYNHIYNDTGNILRLDVSYQNQEFEEGNSYKYLNNSDLPSQVGNTLLTYAYFQ